MASTEEKNFFKEAARYGGWTNPTAPAKAWTAFYEVIVKHLYQDQQVYIPGIGNVKCREVEERTSSKVLPNGKVVDFYYPAKVIPYLLPCDDFVDDINGAGVSAGFRRRLNEGTLSDKDYIRMKRQELLDGESHRVISEEVRNDMRNAFEERLRQEKAKADAKRLAKLKEKEEKQKQEKEETEGNDKQIEE